jgi:hypothetical protein
MGKTDAWIRHGADYSSFFAKPTEPVGGWASDDRFGVLKRTRTAATAFLFDHLAGARHA